jgi:hypothetical protein
MDIIRYKGNRALKINFFSSCRQTIPKTLSLVKKITEQKLYINMSKLLLFMFSFL